MSARRVAVVQGGPSTEAEVSRTSAAAVAGALAARGHAVARFELDAALPAELLAFRPDVVFPVTHGAVGEDGCLQGLLEVLELPYVGSGVKASALAMAKPDARIAFQARDLPVAPGVVVPRDEPVAGAAERVRGAVGRAVVVKPGGGGSGIAVSRLPSSASDREVAEALRRVFEVDDCALVERFVVGQEATCGVLEGDEGPRALPPTLILPRAADWYDFTSRYAPGGSEHRCPAPFPPEVVERVQAVAVAAHRALGCRDLSRVDFVVGDGADGRAVTLLEVNTLPGMTGTSLFPEAAGVAGVPFEALCERLVERALRRGVRAAPPARPMPAGS